MEWSTLRNAIIRKCKEHRKGDEYSEALLSYSEKLFVQNLPIITCPAHLSLLIGLEHDYVCRMAFSPEHFYRHFTIKKANGKDRSIDEPLPDLKFVQQWILSNILENVPVSTYAKAFIKKRGVKENARFHRAQTVVVTMDIKDFFPSINLQQIVNIFCTLGYSNDVSNFIAHLCCYHYSLPQGAPTSPYLSNIRMREFDKKVVDYSSPLKIRYTRYADDISLSGNFNPHTAIKYLSSLVFKEGFSINAEKTRVAYQNARQEITGIVVNSHMQVPKAQRKKIRQEVYYIKKYGLDSHLSHISETRENYLNHLLGKINFARYINPKDQEMQEYYETIKKILILFRNESF
ncbi:retron St85 family RNA-directed DNA polymerase [Caproicibacterium amylolyticum]|uniref:RNA-directed DNA polymerase n=1 Tax=Caproicibacterium amylolyticum TaxID=2766537 RepID=A0A7G9WG67_9FIRM|nr:retron St85 family RNA-directed DNA polymerase [Caproicibacterium amylolyticum]QNO17679.1 RNA-directed DNA polymerase [Caproicibacterium amylolyticum]